MLSWAGGIIQIVDEDIDGFLHGAARLALVGLGIEGIGEDRRIELRIVRPGPGAVVHHDVEVIDQRA